MNPRTGRNPAGSPTQMVVCELDGQWRPEPGDRTAGRGRRTYSWVTSLRLPHVAAASLRSCGSGPCGRKTAHNVLYDTLSTRGDPCGCRRRPSLWLRPHRIGDAQGALHSLAVPPLTFRARGGVEKPACQQDSKEERDRLLRRSRKGSRGETMENGFRK